jgi:Lon protease-like protein
MHVSPQSGLGGDLAPIRIPSVIPLFPLPNVVFFPRTYLPLHIFESRYRRMVRDAASSHQMIGMVLLKEGWETDYEGAPPIFPTGVVGRMVTVQRLSDGRFNILLQGLCRFEIQEELGGDSYRQGRVRLTDFPAPEKKLPSDVRAELVKLVGNFLLTREDGTALANFLKQPVDDEALVHNLSFALDFTPLERQFLLESDSLVQQSRRLLDLLQFKLYERKESTGGGWG